MSAVDPPAASASAGVIFDVDGVLVASPHERAWREVLSDLMEHDWRAIASTTSYTPERFTTAVYQQMVAGKPRLGGARAALDYFGVPDAEQRAAPYADRKQQRVVELINAGAFEAFPDALRFVTALRATGLRLAVASSSRNANDMMRQILLGGSGGTLLDAFDANVCGRDIPRGKPDPMIFLLAAKELGVSPAGCLVVEDAPAGIQAAKAGHMQAIGVARLDDADSLVASGADLVVTTLDDPRCQAAVARLSARA